MVVPLPVIPHGGPLGGEGGVLHGDKEFSLRHLGSREQKLHRVDRFPHVAAAGGRDVVQYALLTFHPGLEPLLHDADGPLHGGAHLRSGDRLEFKDGGAA